MNKLLIVIFMDLFNRLKNINIKLTISCRLRENLLFLTEKTIRLIW